MKIYIFDTEYLSWRKKQSNIIDNPRPKKQFPEIIQIFIKEIFTKQKKHKLLYVEP